MNFNDDILSENNSLADIEEFMRGVGNGIKKGMVHLALSLGVIKRKKLYLEICPSFRQYILLERTHLKYKESLRLARIGENYFLYRKQLEENRIMLIEHMSKVYYLDPEIVQHDPMVFYNLKKLSVRGFSDYIVQKKQTWLDVYPDKEIDGIVTSKGAGLYIGNEKLKGFNVNDARQKIAEGKRLIPVWVTDREADVRRVQRSLDRAGLKE